jgi:bifunctional oligoribonuclease and PAP phosphatase NrnA
MNVSSQGADYAGQIAAANRFLREHDHYLVVSHVNPDGDAASSTYAVGLVLRKLGKSYTLVNEGAIPDKFHGISSEQNVKSWKNGELSDAYTYVICVDCADYSRVGEVQDGIAPEAHILNIDHHATNDRYGEINVVREDAASTTEVLFDLIEQMGLEMDLPLAQCLYTGLLTDTGGFRYANTSPRVLQIASRLIGIGVNGSLLAERYLEKITLSHIELLKRSLSTLKLHANGKIALLYVTTDDIAASNASDEDLEGLVNYPRNIDGVEVGLLFKQRAHDTVKVSFRSAGQVDVSLVARSFGGGGHKRASGCTIQGSIEEAIQQVVAEIEAALA